MFPPGAYLPAILIGAAAYRAVAILLIRSVAMVSHLRKMTLLSHRPTREATGLRRLSPLFPLFTAAQADANASSAKMIGA